MQSMQRKLVISSSPHLRNTAVSTRSLMGDVCIALLPTLVASCWFFGLRSLILCLASVAGAVLAEFIWQKHSKKPSSLGDLSAVVTGLLVAFNLPASAPWWVALVGSLIAIWLVKQMFGGLGQNFLNPALTARTILMLSWTALMASNAMPDAGNWLAGLGGTTVDAVSSATPLASTASGYTLWQLFSGNVPGMLGETCKITLLLGGVYLIIRRVIDWRVPVCFIGTVLIAFWIKTGVLYSVESGANNALYQVCSGGLFLGAFFMATDYVTCPVTKWGRVIMGVGCGVLLFVIRAYNPSYPEGCSFAILFMNVATPFIDRFTAPKPFGFVKPPKAVKAETPAPKPVEGKDGKSEAKADAPADKPDGQTKEAQA